MPPSVDSSTCTPSACLTGSTQKRRNSRDSKDLPDHEELCKKLRGSSPSLSETSPLRSDNVNLVGHLTQESRKKRTVPDNDEYLPSGRPQRGNFPLMQKEDGLLKNLPLGKEKRLSSEYPTDGPIRSMILHLARLTRSILVAYENEKNQENRGSSACMNELAHQRTLNEAATMELAQLRTFHKAATLELSQLRVSNKAAAANIANLQLENMNLVNKEALASAQLGEFQKYGVMRDAINILAAFIMSKALVFKKQAKNSEKVQLVRETKDNEEKKRLQILNLQSSLAMAERELAKHNSEKEELMKEKNENEAKATLAAQDMLCHLEAAKEEVRQMRLNTEELLRKKDEAADKAAKAAAVELEEINSRNEMLLREMQAAREMAAAEMQRMKTALENTTGILEKVISENEEMAKEKVEIESRKIVELKQLQSEKAALEAEREQTCATANRELTKLSSRLEKTVEKLETVQHTSGLEKAKLQSEIEAKTSELGQLQKMLAEVKANTAIKEAQRTAEIHRLRRENEEGHAREAALLEKLQAALPCRSHLAFLINWGLIRPEHSGLNVMPHGS